MRSNVGPGSVGGLQLNIQSVPRSKHFPSGLQNPVS